jgi:hypothetical protein
VATSFLGLLRQGIHHVPLCGSFLPAGPSLARRLVRGARGETCSPRHLGEPRRGLPHLACQRAIHEGWSRGDSNPGPPPCKGGALPTKLRPPRQRPGAFPHRLLPAVGAPGLEPGTSALSGPRSNQLSYAPIGRGCSLSAHDLGPVPKTKQDVDPKNPMPSGRLPGPRALLPGRSRCRPPSPRSLVPRRPLHRPPA